MFEVNEVTTSDVIMFIGMSFVSGCFMVCSEEILDWIGIPNDEQAKENLYDIPINERRARFSIAITTPFLMISMLRACAILFGLDHYSALFLWVGIIQFYTMRFHTYSNIHRITYIHHYMNLCIIMVSWFTYMIDGDVIELPRLALYILMLCLLRYYLGNFNGDIIPYTTNSVSLVQHILWDPIVMYEDFYYGMFIVYDKMSIIYNYLSSCINSHTD